MEQFLTGDVWSEVNKLFTKQQNKIACIAYVTLDNLLLKKGDILICDASTFAIKNAMTSAKKLNSYFKKGVKIYSNNTLHSKLILTESFLVVGSANLSKSSADDLTESSIVTNNDVLISQAKAFCHNLIEESNAITRVDIESLLEIKVLRRGFKPTGKSKTRNKKFGNLYWFISLFPIKERAYNKIKDRVEKTTRVISKREKIDEDEIGFIKWRINTEFGKTAKEGDQVIIKYNNENKTRSDIYPPSTILKKEIVDGFAYFYHDDRNANESKTPWTKFKQIAKNLDLEKAISNRTKIISEMDVQLLKSILKKHL
jgi:hypothetical protein